jgi:hypothetical protein
MYKGQKLLYMAFNAMKNGTGWDRMGYYTPHNS